MKRRWKLLMGFAGLALLAAVAWWALGRRPAWPPLPKPNGYDLLVLAASKVPELPAHITRLPDDQLERLVEDNQRSLEIAREGLNLHCAVPVDYGEGWTAQREPVLMSWNRLARLFEAEAISRSRQGDTNGAMRNCLDLVRFGRAIASEGFQVDSLLGSDCELMGARRLTNLLEGLTAQQCHAAIRALEELEQTREAKAGIERRAHAWQRGRFRIVDEAKRVIETRSLRPRTDVDALREAGIAERAYDDHVREMRLILLRLAARAYELEAGRPPGTASDLVPRYLGSAPIDPETSKPLHLDDKLRSFSRFD